ncbi:aminotransferase class V-fold PLP-dependent enzyme [Bacteroidota bacterium]
MTSRRDFIKSASASAIAAPFLMSLKFKETDPVVNDFPAENDPEYWKLIRKMFPLPDDETYFNTGTLGVQPTMVLNSVVNDMRSNMRNAAQCDYAGNGPLLLSGYSDEINIRTKLAKLINAQTGEISLTQNATMSMNFISNGLDLKKGDEIITTNMEHPGGKCGWELMAKRKGVIIKQVEIPVPANDPGEIVSRLKKLITPNTRVIAMAHIISGFGLILPVKEINYEAKKYDIFTIFDGAQSIGHIPLDMKDIGCDAYYSSPHKWLLAPAGNGLLYVKNDVYDQIWTTIASSQWDNYEDNGYRLTQRGTGNPSLLVGLDKAIDFHNTLGPEKVYKRIKYLGDYLREGLKTIKNVKINSSVHPEMCAGITTYGVAGKTGLEIQNEMWNRKKLQPRAVGENGIRHSTHIYNSIEEIDAGLEIIRNIAG